MIMIEADFNHRDDRGRLILADLSMHRSTPFDQIGARGEAVTFVDGEDVVAGQLELDPAQGWVGVADWTTLEAIETWPHPTTTASGRRT